MEAVTDGKLSELEILWKDAHSVCVVLASGGYPSAYKTGFAISGLDENGGAINSGAVIYHAGTECRDGAFYTSGGRVMGVTASASSLDSALEEAYKAAGAISFEGAHYRRDIGKY
jgi:phosphoribosylamine--glycine ligase